MGNIFQICSDSFNFCDDYLFEDTNDILKNIYKSNVPSDESLELDLDELNDDYSENVIIDDEID